MLRQIVDRSQQKVIYFYFFVKIMRYQTFENWTATATFENMRKKLSFSYYFLYILHAILLNITDEPGLTSSTLCCDVSHISSPSASLLILHQAIYSNLNIRHTKLIVPLYYPSWGFALFFTSFCCAFNLEVVFFVAFILYKPADMHKGCKIIDPRYYDSDMLTSCHTNLSLIYFIIRLVYVL